MVENNLKVWPFIEAIKLLKRFENSEKKDSDLKDWQKFLEEPGKIYNKDNDEDIPF